MSEMTNGPRPTSESRPQTTTKTTVKSTRSFDPSRCDEGCGACWITFAGDRRWCEAEATNVARRDLAEMLAGGGDRG
ncbi:hypothetical protein GA0070608_2409 [Micromonospora peucetia]|uniref:Uncharacterized protein n=1 Tax=Micromonospora peucetia TaxID=47871 RepID=A0A1C6V3Z3_9ACTN|nr:hypothetical protein GA0070608_2409 [Micromonospora peucetia]